MPPVTHLFQVNRHQQAGITEAEADRILADAAGLLQRVDRPGDIATNVIFARLFQVGVFTTGNGVINNSAEFTAIERLAGNVKVVNQIRWCGTAFTTGFPIGCASFNSTSLTVVRWTANEEGVLWAHEFGHNRKLPHRNDPNTVMFPTIFPDNTSVNQFESNALQ